jgi:putative DNA primase/helicase
MSSPLLASALIYADRYHWPVFPLKPKEKVPATQHGLLDATTDTGQIQWWWTAENPEYNIGVRTGDGLVVIDGDRRNQGHLTLRDLIKRHVIWPSTFKVLTADGAHFYFRSDTHLTSGTDALGPGVDVKGQGGYVVAPPSIHPSGHVYQYDVESQSKPAPLPSWVIEARKERSSRLDRARVLSGLPEGERDDQLFRYACMARREKWPQDMAEAALVYLGDRCSPPFPRDEAVKKVNWVYSHYAEGQAPYTPDTMMLSIRSVPHGPR